MNWKDAYGDYLTDANEAIKLIKSGDYVVTGMIEPMELLWALKERDDLEDVGLFCSQSIQGLIGEVAAESKSNFTVYSTFIDPNPRFQKAIEKNKVEFIPASFSAWKKIHSVARHVNVLLLAVTVPDKYGYVTCSTDPEHVAAIIDQADTVIGEINKNLPKTCGGPLIHISQFTKLVEAKSNWHFLIREEVGKYWEDEQAKAMGEYLSELIEDESTIELGVGTMNGNALLNMEGIKDIGIHTEYFGDVLMELVKKGVVTNSKKTINKGYSVCTIGSGSQKFYDFMNENPTIKCMSSDYVLNVGVIASNHKMVAINNAAQIDFLGQVNGEFIKGKQYSGIGGQGDFAKGACLCPDGKSIMAISSTTKNGKYSKIVPFFEPLTPVTTPRTDVEYIVTEYGVARLIGETLCNRVKNIIKVSHPKFRDELEEEAKKLKLI